MSGLADTGDRQNLGNIEYHKLFVDHRPNLVLKLVHLKDIEDVDRFNISGVDGGK